MSFPSPGLENRSPIPHPEAYIVLLDYHQILGLLTVLLLLLGGAFAGGYATGHFLPSLQAIFSPQPHDDIPQPQTTQVPRPHY